MSEEDSGPPAWERPKRDAMALRAGQRIRLSDGSVGEVVNNPNDGVWIIVRDVSDANASEEMVLLSDVAGPAE